MIKEIATGVITVAALAIGATAITQGVSSHDLMQTNKQNYTKSLQTKNQYDRLTKNLTKDHVANTMIKWQVNNYDAKKDATDRVNNAFNVAYSNVGSDQYGEAKKNIDKQLGKGQFSKTLTDLINPNNAIPYSNHLEECKIGFGKYDPASYELPMVITAKYKATDASKNDSNDYWTATYNVKSKAFTQVHHTSIFTPQNS